MPTDNEYKTRENRVRRMAERQGLKLAKTRRRDPRAVDYGHYFLSREGVQLLTTPNLDDVEHFLTH